MKPTGCCTSVSLVFHVYMSAAYCEQYSILFHIKMRNIVQNKVVPSILWFTLYCDIIHNNNILTKYNYTRSTLKINVIDGSHFDILNVDYNPIQQPVCGITNYSVHGLHLII